MRQHLAPLGALAPVQHRRSARWLIVGGLLLPAAVVGQTTGALYLPEGWPRADIGLAVALAWAWRRGRGEGVGLALGGGLLLDLASAAPLGLHVLALGLALLLVESAGELLAGSWPGRLVATVCAGALVHLVVLTGLWLRGWAIDWSRALAQATLPALGADLVVGVVLYYLLGGLLGTSAASGSAR
ncbi:MAG TPA: rod shape-determining protein MreD [Chloroflexota bacterium]|jgi:cell shape-determining protein MreD|nr:rod shape-determining protein MreD [Chloroflexota bacterium]